MLWRSAHWSEPAAVTVGLQLSLLRLLVLVVEVGGKGGGGLWVTHKVKTRYHEFNKSETGAAFDGGGGVLRLVENKQYGGS